MTRLAALGLLLLLAACAGTNPARESARNVCAIAYGDPALDPVRQKIPWDDDAAIKAAMHFLADNSKPTDVERQALQTLDAANRRCWDAWDQAGRSPVIQSARSSISASLAELYNGRITYGEYNRRRANALADMRAKMQEAEERERALYYARRPLHCTRMGPWGFPGSLHCW
jgi:hypothetical protein